MNNQNTPYNNQQPGQQTGQQPMRAPMMPPPPMPQQAPRGWRARWMRRLGSGNGVPVKNIFPQWLSQYAIATYVLALAIVTLMYSSYSIAWYYMLSGVVGILVFFLYGNKVVQDTAIDKIRKTRTFEKRIFWIALVPRMLWTIIIYYLFMQSYGDSFGFENADPQYYHDLGVYVSDMINHGDFHFYDAISKWSGNKDVADMGYGVYVGFIYRMTDNSIIVVRLLKCVWSSLTVLLVYRLAKRNFGEQTARVAAIFCALWPNFWYYCGTHLKETEMTFLAVMFVEQADQMLRSRQFTAWKVIPVLLIAAAIFTFRTVLALVAILALLFTIVMSSSRVVSWGKRIIVGVLALLLIGVTMGNRIQEQTRTLVDTVQSDSQQKNMEWRTRRTHGNAFAEYAGKSVFAPLIFTIPFPTMIKPFDGQDQQQLLNGSNFIKNIVSGLTIFAMMLLLISGDWRKHLLPLAFMAGYLAVLAFSSFAHSERFHQPVMPLEFMFAAYGLSIAATNVKYKRWFMYWCGLMSIAAIAWNWFKLAGRGLV